MAIHTPDDPSAPTQPIDIAAWTEEATAAISTMTLSAPVDPEPELELESRPEPQSSRGMYAPIHISIDEPLRSETDKPSSSALYKRKEPLRRDSLKRREALLKGKEGSRRRRKWENDRLLSVPNAQPPTPRDWEIHPTHPVHHVPYYLAPLWDAGLARQSARREAAAAAAARKRKAQALAQAQAQSQAQSQAQGRNNTSSISVVAVASKPTDPGVVPRELREKMKKKRGARGLLMDLEGEVRAFVERVGERERRRNEGRRMMMIPVDEELEVDSEEDVDEVVFVGRNNRAPPRQIPSRSNNNEKEEEIEVEEDIHHSMLILETPAGDRSGTFARWLVHHIGTYYGLRTWSVTRGDPARREAYIGVKKETTAAAGKSGGGLGLRAGMPRREGVCNPLPRPLWGLV
ncbi:uncharacterized protein EI97DRAFT_434087 [Westerdykella ornata]|uniref:R3H-associated N-terminal domain-containing protein n=1 Tax=Westerdykella ornata TaxID=318751 RepID=A0A6A6JL77_WESOR|nr:uncharacterized protein EI97DRAFT_434087 [Westerdykella ornata]KAF2275669.1 hypothetical protein EI97DRAFT_434087 [Westerdykella ornata]